VHFLPYHAEEPWPHTVSALILDRKFIVFMLKPNEFYLYFNESLS